MGQVEIFPQVTDRESNASAMFCNKGPSSAVSSVYTSGGGTSDTIDIGQGSLKLTYSAKEGKLTRYVNSRSLVCYILRCKFRSTYFC